MIDVALIMILSFFLLMLLTVVFGDLISKGNKAGIWLSDSPHKSWKILLKHLDKKERVELETSTSFDTLHPETAGKTGDRKMYALNEKNYSRLNRKIRKLRAQQYQHYILPARVENNSKLSENFLIRTLYSCSGADKEYAVRILEEEVKGLTSKNKRSEETTKRKEGNLPEWLAHNSLSSWDAIVAELDTKTKKERAQEAPVSTLSDQDFIDYKMYMLNEKNGSTLNENIRGVRRGQYSNYSGRKAVERYSGFSDKFIMEALYSTSIEVKQWVFEGLRKENSFSAKRDNPKYVKDWNTWTQERMLQTATDKPTQSDRGEIQEEPVDVSVGSVNEGSSIGQMNSYSIHDSNNRVKSDGTSVLDKWKKVRQDHRDALNTVGSYETDISLAITYPAFNDLRVPEVKEMTGVMRKADRFFTMSTFVDIDEGIDRNKANKIPDDESFREYADLVADFVLSVEVAEKAARAIADSDLSEKERSMLETARGLFKHVQDPANSADMRANYYGKLKDIFSKLNEHHTIVPMKVVGEIEEQSRKLLTAGNNVETGVTVESLLSSQNEKDMVR